MIQVKIWPVHFADDIPRWRVATFSEGVIIVERMFHDEEEALEYYQTLVGING